jgi:hypothetical protein
MKDPENDDLWALLGQARNPEASPFFAAKVVAAVRRGKEKRRAFWRNWLSYGLPGAAAGALAVFLTFFSNPHTHVRKVPATPAGIAQVEPADTEVIENLDYNLASQESSVWVETSTR